MMNANEQFNDFPFNGPGEWYPYVCRACKYKYFVEDIIIDAFPHDGPGDCPIICCYECGGDFVRDIKRPTIMSEKDPNYDN